MTPSRRGAHPQKFLQVGTSDAIARLLAVQPTMMTVAPDVVEEAAWLELQRSGTRLSLGHSDCTEAQASRAFEKVGHWGGLTVRACLLSRISSTL